MKTCIYLSYKGLGANLLHLAYCHKIAQKYGPVTIITLCNNLEVALKEDPLIDKIVFKFLFDFTSTFITFFGGQEETRTLKPCGTGF